MIIPGIFYACVLLEMKCIKSIPIAISCYEVFSAEIHSNSSLFSNAGNMILAFQVGIVCKT